MAIFFSIVGGLVLLVAGGELLVRGAVQAAARLGVSPLVIGLTLVGFGTSTPELVTSVQAALGGSPGIARDRLRQCRRPDRVPDLVMPAKAGIP